MEWLARCPSKAVAAGALGVAMAMPANASSATVVVATRESAIDPSGVTLVVSPQGSDSADGTSARPLGTVAAAVAKAAPGSKILLRPGTYHESLTVQGKDGLTIASTGKGPVWFDGSRRVGSWRAAGSVWVHDGWTAEFDSSPTFTPGAPDSSDPNWQFVNPKYPMAAHPDQLWVDGRPQRQVASASLVRPGTFFVSYAHNRLYLGSNPRGHEVRASDLAKAMTIRSTGVKVQGVGIRRYAPSVPTMGAVTVEGDGCRFSNVVISDNSVTGIFVNAARVRLERVSALRNGMLGVHANDAQRLRLLGVVARGNNTEHFNHAPVSGGVKVTRSTGIRVRAGDFSRNDGTGLWFDEAVYDLRVRGATIRDNNANGLSLELSGTALVGGNVVAGNSEAGIKVNDTDNTKIDNNTLIGNGRSVYVAQDWRDVDPGGSYVDPSLPLSYRIKNVSLRNNIMGAPNRSAECLLCAYDFTKRFTGAALNLRADGNVYQRKNASTPRWTVVWPNGSDIKALTTMADFTSTFGQERRGLARDGRAVVDKRFRPSAAIKKAAPSHAYRVPWWVATATNLPKGKRWFGALR